MPKKKKPSFSVVLLGEFTKSIFGLVFTAIPGAIQIYAFLGGSVNMLDNLPPWIWFAPLALYIIYVVVRAIFQYRKELAEYNSSKSRPRKEKPKSNKASDKSVAMQDVSNSPITKTTKTTTADNNSTALQDVSISNSFNVSNAPHAFYEPTKEQLLYRIGVDIQKFGEEFKAIRNTSLDKKFDKWLEVNKNFDSINRELLPPANLKLKDTPIPSLFTEIQRNLTRYSLQIADLSQAEADRLFHGRSSGGQVPKEVIDRFWQITDRLKQLDDETDAMVNKVIEVVRSRGVTWLVS